MNIDDFFAAVEQRQIDTPALRKHYGMHVKPMTQEEAQAALRDAGNGQAFDGIRRKHESTDEWATYMRGYRARTTGRRQ